ncbi:hypothetical protein ACQP04_24995 [Pseudonocardia halophobica]|uniref:hypothetical protein n=1 Tax=Pseudonocardia halophobica TaxID=29401 RepID=UPI003D8C39BF
MSQVDHQVAPVVIRPARARPGTTIQLAELLRTFADLAVAGEQVRVDSPMEYGSRKLPLAFEAR